RRAQLGAWSRPRRCLPGRDRGCPRPRAERTLRPRRRPVRARRAQRAPARDAGAGRPTRARLRPLQRRPSGAAELRPSGRRGGRRASACRPHRLQTSRARGAHRSLGARRQPPRARLPEPTLRPPVHPLARRQCGRRARGAALEAWELLLAFAAAFAAGYLGSMLGLVLGTLRLPFIVIATGSPLAAQGPYIAISAAAAGAGGLRHARESRVDWRVVSWIAFPSVAGAVLGALVADDVSESLLYGLIAAVLVWSGVDLALRPIAPRPRVRLRLVRGAALAFFIAVLGGAVGVLLGTLPMPALIRSVGMDVRRAAGTNLVVGFLLGVAGFVTHSLQEGVDWAILGAGLAGAIPGGWLGARATGLISENRLRLALGATLLLVGAAF